MIQSRFFSHVREGTVMIVMIESGFRAFRRQAEFVRDDFVKHGVAGGDAAHECLDSYSRRQCAFPELAMAVVEEQLAWMRMGAIARFVSNEQVNPSVVICIEPDCGERRIKREQAGFFSDIGKSAVAV